MARLFRAAPSRTMSEKTRRLSWRSRARESETAARYARSGGAAAERTWGGRPFRVAARDRRAQRDLLCLRADCAVGVPRRGLERAEVPSCPGGRLHPDTSLG